MKTQESRIPLVNRTLAGISELNGLSFDLYSSIYSEDILTAQQVIDNMCSLLLSLVSIGIEQRKSNPNIELNGAAESTFESLDRIIEYSNTNIALALHKIEFELIPFIQTMLADYYLTAIIQPDISKYGKYLDSERAELFANRYIDESIITGQYKYEISIFVIGYNKLEYTKRCVESLQANLPKNCTYELIFINNGSDDGTKEYFESQNPSKQLDINVNGAMKEVWWRVVEGKYIVHISNDTIITQNAIDNMIRTIREDESIGFIVPTTTSVSNLQTIPHNFNSMESLKHFAKSNNVYNPYRHEQRVRLCNPISVLKSETFLGKNGIGLLGRPFGMSSVCFSFPDDAMSLLFRRCGLKNILCKDAFCYHFGSISIQEDSKQKQINQEKAYTDGRVAFKKVFNIDPWGIGFCYDPELFLKSDMTSKFDCKFSGHIEILGINCGLGSNPLKIKELYKEERHNLDVTLTNVTNDKTVLEDLRGISDSVAGIATLEDVFLGGRNRQYHYIIADETIGRKTDQRRYLKMLYEHLLENGELYIKCLLEVLPFDIGVKQQFGDWIKIIKK